MDDSVDIAAYYLAAVTFAASTYCALPFAPRIAAHTIMTGTYALALKYVADDRWRRRHSRLLCRLPSRRHIISIMLSTFLCSI